MTAEKVLARTVSPGYLQAFLKNGEITLLHVQTASESQGFHEPTAHRLVTSPLPPSLQPEPLLTHLEAVSTRPSGLFRKRALTCLSLSLSVLIFCNPNHFPTCSLKGPGLLSSIVPIGSAGATAVAFLCLELCESGCPRLGPCPHSGLTSTAPPRKSSPSPGHLYPLRGSFPHDSYCCLRSPTRCIVLFLFFS